METWRKNRTATDLGPDGEFTLLATRLLATTLRTLGFVERARRLVEDTLQRFEANPEFGPLHEHTLFTLADVASDSASPENSRSHWYRKTSRSGGTSTSSATTIPRRSGCRAIVR